MSILADPEWALYQLRLGYLRRIDDHHGPRIIAFPQSHAPTPSTSHVKPGAHIQKQQQQQRHYDADLLPHGIGAAARCSSALPPASQDSQVAMARLNDPLKFPEITAAYSPVLGPQRNARPTGAGIRALSPPSASSRRLRRQPSGSTTVPETVLRKDPQGMLASTSDQPQGHPPNRKTPQIPSSQPDDPAVAGPSRTAAPGLRYTQTIYGPGRTGALGMRVSGKRSQDVVPPSSSSHSILSRDQRAADDSRSERRATPRRRPEARRGTDSILAGPALSSTAHNAAQRERHSFDSGSSVPQFGLQGATADGNQSILADIGEADFADIPSTRQMDGGRHRLTSLPPEVSTSTDTEAHYDNVPSKSMLRTASASAIHRSDDRVVESTRRRSATIQDPNHQDSSPGNIVTTAGDKMRSLRDGEEKHQTVNTLSPHAGAPPPVKHRASHSAAPYTPSRPAKNALRHLQSDSSLSSLVSTTDASLMDSPELHAHSRRPAPSSERDTVSPGVHAVARTSPRSLAHLENTELSGAKDHAPDGRNRQGMEPKASQVSDATSNRREIPQVRIQPSHESNSTAVHVKPSSEALIAARSKLRKPSRSHLQGKTPAERNAERERQQNAWFQSLAISNQQLASRSEASKQESPRPSALSLLLRKQSAAPENPFAQFYAGIAGRSSAVGPGGSAQIDVYFPWSQGPASVPSSSTPSSGALSTHPSTRCFTLSVRKDATMEELIGYGLYCYIEEGWLPPLEDKGAEEVVLSTLGWVLRIVEDGEVDDDYPSLDRNLTVGKFGGDEFAICEASQIQIKQHEAAFSLIKRRASRVVVSPRKGQALQGASAAMGQSLMRPNYPRTLKTGAAGIKSNLPVSSMAAAAIASQSNMATSASNANTYGTPLLSASPLSRTTPTGNVSLGSAGAPPIFLRVLITPNNEVRYKTTLSVESEMYLADVLDLICKKRQLGSPDEWALIVPGDGSDQHKDIVVPLDRTVESLQGSHDLALVRRATLGAQGGTSALAGQSTNPKASIFRSAEEQGTGAGGTGAYTKAEGAGKGLGLKGLASTQSVYKSWTVTRRLPPMFHVGSHRQHERTLTIDGDWIHIIPSDSRAFQAHAASFPITDVASCKQSGKVSTSFKLLVFVKRVQGGGGSSSSSSNFSSAYSAGSQQKRYDLEAEDGRQAAEIVSEINSRRRRSRN